MSESEADIRRQVELWLQRVVVGLGLCPFAARPIAEQRVRIVISRATSGQAMLEDLHHELERMDKLGSQQVETSLLVAADGFKAFEQYNQFLDDIDALLEAGAWLGVYQIASFHPDYRFANTEAGDAENLTNRSPYPIFQVLREASLGQQLQDFARPERIPEDNIRKMNGLSASEKRRCFPYLYSDEVNPAD